jgi:hypothetical protein
VVAKAAETDMVAVPRLLRPGSLIHRPYGVVLAAVCAKKEVATGGCYRGSVVAYCWSSGGYLSMVYLLICQSMVE